MNKNKKNILEIYETYKYEDKANVQKVGTQNVESIDH